MVTKKHGIIVETPTEARQAEPGWSVLALLTISTSRIDPWRRLVCVLLNLTGNPPAPTRLLERV
jgi:hypothetical protein